MVRKKLNIIPAKEWESMAGDIVEIINNGGIAVFPTETVYGCGSTADDIGVEKLSSLKGRAKGKPFQVLISDRTALEKWGAKTSEAAMKLMDRFWPGAMTLVLEVDPAKAPARLAPKGKVGFRMPDHGMCLDLIRRCGGAIAATSANPSGKPVAKTCREAANYFQGQLDALIDGGALPDDSPSTVVSVNGDLATILREGVIPEKDIINAIDD